MIQVILILHLLLAIALVAAVLLQRSEGGALGMGGGSTMGGMMTTRGTANLLTRATALLAACFIATSLTLAIMSSSERTPTSILDNPGATVPAQSVPTSPPTGPTVPLGK
ncbi:MAG: Protein-export membrane protein SecG [Alphaproteobacteria bacterium MarineAlpha11_Bin1]|nr:MAG: Protein-export membrane protein SecG [Alphaproteobacteria bacterium MarineAlpha11_Bin1]|tara:strand:- start:14715 stop:15044 length:330 start_codon:yes stop_codon:yes gene_type:complete